MGILAKEKAKHQIPGISNRIHDSINNVITIEYDKFILMCVHFPETRKDMMNLNFKCEDFGNSFIEFIKQNIIKSKSKNLIIVGNLNIASENLDINDNRIDKFSPGCTEKERKFFNSLINIGICDSFRETHLFDVY